MSQSATEDFIPYLVFVRFDKDQQELKARLAESVPLLKEALAEVGTVQFVEASYDASTVAFLVAADPRFENTLKVLNHLQSPRSRNGSALIRRDKVLVVEVHMGSASRLERVTGWLNEFGMLAE